MSVFVLEIGTEELPARFLAGLEAELREKFSAGLLAAGLEYGFLTVSSTPRRFLAYVENVAGKSRESEDVVTGPPVKASFDAEGRPTKAGEGFARAQGVDFSAVFTINTGKGEYVAVRKKSGGESAISILADLCQNVVNSLSFPKRMRWGIGDYTFARPLRWILALLDDKVVSFRSCEVESGRATRGHRVHGFGPFALENASGYFALMREQGVTPDALARREAIIDGGNALAAGIGGKILWKESLLDEVQGLCEHPVPLLGSFEESFLEVPRAVLITSMDSHQKSFGLENPEGRLLPHFLTVLNITPVDENIVRRGWEKVLRARLEDARFFWKTDLASSFDNWLDKLDKIIFLAPLGSMGDKTRRISALAGWLAEVAGGVRKEDAIRAGRLSKADLASAMVGEFDTLQGIMGGIYADKMGENPVVAQAISEQYLPAGPDSPLPANICGALLSIADKADTLVGCFGLGMMPTGAADPYALRRCVLGIARIMVEKKLRLKARDIFAKAQELYGEKKWKFTPSATLDKLDDFFTMRLKNYFTGKGSETLLVEAVLLADANEVWAASARLAAIQRFSARQDFSEAVLTFKRAANIIRKQ